ncbi:3-keto-L-gulonate 6-phosphate decarboxylase [Agrococcus baldri]|uniref:3-keto-L-gulonate 6-phosphate decarboxylase n=1 Tax=Agrococcus baldri TaxID=153730 RepID=A0AA94KZP7_9MICO|nr:orotidine 5'-phosphate decarboxylase / HUMPS family protein [Agrococcus baldri]SFS11308.1 3-keto-L-gulonate 6-phosphate decarboxylase [Agrococcus baldri]
MTQIQLALDTRTVEEAVAAASSAAASINIVEAGTVLCLSQGLGSIAALQDAVPGLPIVADIRIARAGRKFAQLAFDAGADRVTVVGESGLGIVQGALEAAQSAGGEVEVELWDAWTDDDVKAWVDAGVATIIAHRSGRFDAEHDDDIRAHLDRLAALDLGETTVTLAGGISAGEMRWFDTGQFDAVVAGSAIVGAADPGAAARDLRAALELQAVAS